MRRPAATMLAMLMPAVGAAEHAIAAESGPVCREQSVVDEMTRQVRTQAYYGSVDPRLITEQPTADPRVVRCQVCVQMAPYNMTRFDVRPIENCVARGFEIQILSNGFVVQDLR